MVLFSRSFSCLFSKAFDAEHNAVPADVVASPEVWKMISPFFRAELRQCNHDDDHKEEVKKPPKKSKLKKNSSKDSPVSRNNSFAGEFDDRHAFISACTARLRVGRPILSPSLHFSSLSDID